MSNQKWLSTAEMARELSVTVRHLRRWIGRGCPCRRVKPRSGGGHPRLRFQPPLVRAWLIEHGITSRPPSSPAAAITKPQPTFPKSGGGIINQKGIRGAVERCRIIERDLFELREKTKEHNPGLAASYARQHKEALDNLRKLEKDVAGIRQSQGDVIPVADARAILTRMATEAKSALINLPRSVAPRLPGLKPAEIENVLRDEIDAILRRLSEGKIDSTS